MKSGSKFIFLLFIALLTVSSTETTETHIITLQVDTGAITVDNVNEVSNFGQGPGIPNEDFTIVVSPGDIVMWKGVSSTAPDTDEVLITSINHEGGARVFGRNTLRDNSQNPGVVLGVVSDGKEGDEEKYKVSFKVMNNGEKRNGTFHIDPKIQVR